MTVKSQLGPEELATLNELTSSPRNVGRLLSADQRLGYQNQARDNANRQNQNQKRAGQHHETASTPLTTEQAETLKALLAKDASLDELLATRQELNLG